MKNLIIGTLIICASAGSFVFNEKYFGACVIFMLVGFVFGVIGFFQTISKSEE
jgi:hypothetical protein